MQFLMFSKMLKNIGKLPLGEAGDRIKAMGFDGVDLTVRTGGYVLPERVAETLPVAIETLRSKGLVVPMITTEITDARGKNTASVFRTASRLGVRFLKLGYWQYEGFGAIEKQIQRTREQLEGLEALSREYAMTSTLHIHSGPFLTADAAVVLRLLEGYDADLLGAYIDPGHMTIEGGLSGWKMGIDLLSPYIRLVAVKDFGWFKRRGAKNWEFRLIPLSQGMVRWHEVFSCLADIGYNGPVSLHSEYEYMNLNELLDQTQRDLQYVKRVVKEVEERRA